MRWKCEVNSQWHLKVRTKLNEYFDTRWICYAVTFTRVYTKHIHLTGDVKQKFFCLSHSSIFEGWTSGHNWEKRAFERKQQDKATLGDAQVTQFYHEWRKAGVQCKMRRKLPVSLAIVFHHWRHFLACEATVNWDWTSDTCLCVCEYALSWRRRKKKEWEERIE